MWERTLQDLVRGLRANKKDESKFIAKAVEEIRNEIKSEDMELKAAALLKLTYLDMLGYDMSWASFHVVEVMSSPKFHLKSVGYLAAVQSFNQETDVLMLTTNLLKKDLISNPGDISVTLNGLSHIATHELARDLSPELLRMLSHSQPIIRKRSILVLYKLMLKYPDIRPQALDKIKEKLEDTDSSVVASAVNVLCEMARYTPQDLLTFAPPLFHILTTSSNNWMLIKIIKLFGHLCPHEPRLVRKLQSPITELISTTPAISLLYECVHTCIIGGMLQGSSGDSLARTCVSKLANFIKDADQNLKYIALMALTKIVPSHPHLVAEYQDTIIASVNDEDISIRLRALDLVTAMVDQHNIQSVVQQLLAHLVPETTSLPSAAESLAQHGTPTKSAIPLSQSRTYRLTLSQRILSMCSASTYENITNFEWYLSVLVDMAHIANVDVGGEIRDQLIDVVGRVKGSRRYAVKLMFSLLSDETLLINAKEEGSCSEVLYAAAWICGEHCSEMVDAHKLLPFILRPEISNLQPDIIAVYIQSAIKIFGHWAAELAQRWTSEDLSEVKSLTEMVINQVSKFTGSPHSEVQERAANALQLFKFIQADLNSYKPRPDLVNNPFAEASTSFDPMSEPNFPKSLYLIQPLFSAYPLNPVAPTAQESVPIPEGLDLDQWIAPPPPDPVDDEKRKPSKKGKGKESANGVAAKKKGKKKKDADPYEYDEDDGVLESTRPPEPIETPEDIAARERRKAERLERLKDDPYYIIDDKPVEKKPDFDPESIPVVTLEDMPALKETVDPRLPSLRDDPYQNFDHMDIDREGEMPKNATPRVTTPSGQDTPPSSLPEPIKVQRVKKNGTAKKKRVKDKP